jgi:hypothetical protein
MPDDSPDDSFESHPSGLLLPRGVPAAQAAVTPPAEQQEPPAFRNISRIQFKPGGRAYNAAVRATQNQQVFNYFRSAGMGAAVRYAVGLPQMSDQMTTLYRQRALQNLAQRPGPGRYEATPSSQAVSNLRATLASTYAPGPPFQQAQQPAQQPSNGGNGDADE